VSAPIDWSPGGWNYSLDGPFAELTGNALRARGADVPGPRNPDSVTSAAEAGTDYDSIAYVPLGLTGEAANE
jgi:hypothetical protein